MKILYLLSQRPDSTGSGFYVQAVMKEAVEAGHNSFLVAGVPKGFQAADNSSFLYFEDPDLPFPVPGMSDVMPYKSTRFIEMSEKEIDDYKNSFKKIISEAVETFKPDVIHSNHLWIMSAVARELFPDIKMVTSCHGTDLRQLNNCAHLRKDIIKSCRKIDRIIALSEIQKKEIRTIFDIPEENVVVAGSGFNDLLFKPAQKPETPPVKLLYAGKLSASKGVLWLLDSLNRLKNLNTPFHLYLAGAGTGNEYNRCRILAEKMKDKVTLCGALKQEQLAKLMQESHIFILPSFFEGLPLVLFEALASGCRLITTALPGAREIAGNAGTDLIRFIDLPELETIDTPFQSDMPGLIENLAGILREEIENYSEKKEVEKTEADKITVRFTWKDVFKRIEISYNVTL